MMYKITDTEARRLATVFLEQPVEVQARFTEIVTFVGDQFMPVHARTRTCTADLLAGTP